MSLCFFHQGRETTWMSEGGAQGLSSSTGGPDRNSERTSAGGSSKKGECTEDDMTNKNTQSPEQRRKDTSSRRPRDIRETEKARVNISSREFVRGGRGRLRGSARGRGRGGHHDVYGSALYREVETMNQSGSTDNDLSARVASALSNTVKTDGSEQKRSDAQQSKTGSSREALIGGQQMPKVEAEDRRNGRGAGHFLPDDCGIKPSNSGSGSAARDAGRWGDVLAQSNRRRTEFYDSRNRGQMRQSDARGNNGNRRQQQQPHSTLAKDGADAEKNAMASNLEVADTSQRKPGKRSEFDYFCLL